MLFRLLFAAVVLHGLTAFAPAPLPKTKRVKDHQLTLERVTGIWIVQKVEKSSKGGYVATTDSLKQVRIENAKWSFCDANGMASRTSDIRVDGSQSPTAFDLSESGTVQTAGIIRLRGDEMQVLYQWGRPRATNFEAPPDEYWLITFKRR